MSLYPDNLDLDLLLGRQPVLPLVRKAIEIMNERQNRFREWQMPATGPRTKELEALFEAVASVDRAPRPTSITLFFDNRAHFFIPVDPENETWPARLTIDTQERPPDEIGAGLLLGHFFLSALLESTDVAKASFNRVGAGLAAMPYVPLIGRSHLALVTKEQVEENYDDPEIFWGTPWQSKDRHGDRFLVARGLDLPDTADFYDRVLEEQMALARAAAPGCTRYRTPVAADEERDIFFRGESALNPVGYLPASRTVEYSCAASPGAHIPVWEIYTIARMVREKRVQGGRVVDTVRIVFLNEETARLEKRPLLDVGAQVHHYNDQGELVQLFE